MPPLHITSIIISIIPNVISYVNNYYILLCKLFCKITAEGNKYIHSLALSAVLWYNDVNNLIRCGGLADIMWLATGRVGADLSKTFSKKSLEIVLEAENLALLKFSDFGNDKTPKPLEFTGFSAFYIVF